MYRYMECLTGVYPEMLEMIEIGKSFEGRPLVVLKISGNQPGVDAPGGGRRAIWMDANIHSREWITSASVFYLINQIVENQGNRFNRDILRGFDIYIMPMANPDGYGVELSDVEQLPYFSKYKTMCLIFKIFNDYKRASYIQKTLLFG